jgi:hypothetical protein
MAAAIACQAAAAPSGDYIPDQSPLPDDLLCAIRMTISSFGGFAD